MNEKIRILMATYNGEKYIEEQIKSIQYQTYSNWELSILDDCSTDNTMKILNEIANKDKRITVQQNKKNLGQIETFDKLLEQSLHISYVMFCDQDDIWDETKVEKTYKNMKEMEQTHPNEAILIYTNLTYVDEELKEIDMKTRDYKKTLESALSYNVAWGCTMMLNKQLAQISHGFAKKAENHDYWIYLVALIKGKVRYIEESTLMYRQHTSNVTGGMNNHSFLKKIQRVTKVYSGFEKTINQNVEVCSMFPENHICNEYTRIFSKKYLSRFLKAKKFGLEKSTKNEDALFKLFLLFNHKRYVNKTKVVEVR